jgi:putative oxidoreductase
MGFLRNYESQIYAVTRMVVAFLFIQHGIVKLQSFFSGAEQQLPGFLFWPAVLIELVGGTLILLGVFTRPAAFICSGMMAVGYFMVHVGQVGGLLPITNQGEPAALYAWIFLLIAARGDGSWSLARGGDSDFQGRK